MELQKGIAILWFRDWHISPSRLLRSEEHTSELQSRSDLVCRLLLEKKNIVTIVELGLTFTSVAIVGFWAGLTYLEAIFAAGVVSITSTAILSKLLVETDTLHSKGSQLALTVSVVEDVSSILILILLPGLVAADRQLSIIQFLIFVGKGLLL